MEACDAGTAIRWHSTNLEAVQHLEASNSIHTKPLLTQSHLFFFFASPKEVTSQVRSLYTMRNTMHVREDMNENSHYSLLN